MNLTNLTEDQSVASRQRENKPASLSRGNQIAEAFVLAVVVAVPALVCMRIAFVADADVWWHMRTAQWILQHHSVPATDPFGRAADLSWAAYSWLFELLVLKCFYRFGLAGILVYSTAMVAAITAALYHLIRRLQSDFLIAVFLTLVASLSLIRLYTPRAWLFSILFFAVQLDILLHVRKTGRVRQLLWLPILYALWANLHIQFFDGLVVLGIAVGEAVLSRWWVPARTRLSPAWAICIGIACFLAATINPYGWRIYEIGIHAATQPGILYLIAEFHAPEFRMLADYSMLFLALAASAALAWHRRFSFFETLLLIFAAIVSFRSGRDMWIIIIIATAILAQGIRGKDSGKDRPGQPLFTLPLIAAVVGLILFAGTRAMHLSNAQLSNQVTKRLPVRAVEAVKQKGLHGPLYNNFDWGGYLIWSLRMPVSVDGRADLYGDKRLQRSFLTWNGAPDWASDPNLQSAALVIGPINDPLTQILRLDPRFQLVYQDQLAAVFAANKSGDDSTNSGKSVSRAGNRQKSPKSEAKSNGFPHLTLQP